MALRMSDEFKPSPSARNNQQPPSIDLSNELRRTESDVESEPRPSATEEDLAIRPFAKVSYEVSTSSLGSVGGCESLAVVVGMRVGGEVRIDVDASLEYVPVRPVVRSSLGQV